MNRNDLVLLMKIKDQCDRIEKKLEKINKDFEIFKKDLMVYDSISMNIFQIGEAAGHLSEEYIQKTLDQISWFEIRGMRNRFGHDYYSMDPKIIFDTALNDIPILKKFIDKEISN